jgi:exodeoxyribonuclease VII large subunit
VRTEAEPRVVLRVSELVACVRDALHERFGELCVEGEISGLARSSPGHLYFALKDPDGQLRAVMFRSDAARLGFDLEEGMQVRVIGRLDVYPERGALQLIVARAEPAGEGALRRAFERMRERLAAEGLFDPAHKRPLPRFPRRIGLVTSKGGAAIHDVLRGLRRRQSGVEVVLYDARVQGEDAWRDLVRGLHLLSADPTIEVIVLARGGGSLEDLWSFNREELVRAVFELATPVVSAVGHEVDVVLTDLVADARAATPTAAADLVLPDGAALRARVGDLARRLVREPRARLRELGHRIQALRRGLVHPAARLAELARRLGDARARLERSAREGMLRRGARIEALSGRLDALSPLAVLGRGYAIARREPDGAILRASREVEAGAELRVRLHEGSLRARVLERLAEDAG